MLSSAPAIALRPMETTMSTYTDPQGRKVNAAHALIGGKLRPSYREILDIGERVSFDVNFMDAKRANPTPSIDDVILPVIDGLAKIEGLSGPQYIARMTFDDLEHMAAAVSFYTVDQRPALYKILADGADQARRERLTAPSAGTLRRARFNRY